MKAIEKNTEIDIKIKSTGRPMDHELLLAMARADGFSIWRRNI